MSPDAAKRATLLAAIRRLAAAAIFGTASETLRRCGNPGCRCHHGGPKHGPHLYVHFRKPDGKTGGYYVPEALKAEVREGIAAWHELQERVRELAALNTERIRERKNAAKSARRKA